MWPIEELPSKPDTRQEEGVLGLACILLRLQPLEIERPECWVICVEGMKRRNRCKSHRHGSRPRWAIFYGFGWASDGKGELIWQYYGKWLCPLIRLRFRDLGQVIDALWSHLCRLWPVEEAPWQLLWMWKSWKLLKELMCMCVVTKEISRRNRSENWLELRKQPYLKFYSIKNTLTYIKNILNYYINPFKSCHSKRRWRWNFNSENWQFHL